MTTMQTQTPSRRDLLGALAPTVAAAALLSAAIPASADPAANASFVTGADFGAKGDGVTDDTVALQNALDYCLKNKRSLYLIKGEYRVSDTLIKANSTRMVNIFGEGVDNTIIRSTNSSKPILKIIGLTGEHVLGNISHITFEGASTNVAIEIADQCNIVIEYCNFKKCSVALLLHNERLGGYTEFVKALNCTFANGCVVGMELKRTNGDASFHGCGIGGRSVIADLATVVRINSGCILYNSEFNMQVFAHSTTIIFENLSNQLSYAYGCITLEPQITNSDTVTLATGTTWFPFAGNISSIGSQSIKFGKLFQCVSILVDAISAFSYTGARYSKSVTALKSTTLGSPISTTARQVYVQIVAQNYVYRALLWVEHNGFGGNGICSIIQAGLFFNGAGYGAPTFTVDSQGQLIVVNSRFPLSGVSINYQEQQISQGINSNFVGA